MLEYILLLALSDPQIIHVDRLELNIYRNSPDMPYTTQVIAWDWDAYHRRYNVVTWAHPDNNILQIPYLFSPGVFRVRIREHTFQAPIYSVTKTEYDPERQNLLLHPQRRTLP